MPVPRALAGHAVPNCYCCGFDNKPVFCNHFMQAGGFVQDGPKMSINHIKFLPKRLNGFLAYITRVKSMFSIILMGMLNFIGVMLIVFFSFQFR